MLLSTFARRLWLRVCFTWLSLFVYKCVSAVYITSVKPSCPFPGRLCRMVETTWHGKETRRLASISIQIEGEKTEFSPIDQWSDHSHVRVGGFLCTPLSSVRRWSAVGGLGDKKWLLSDLDALWCIIHQAIQNKEFGDKDCGEYQDTDWFPQFITVGWCFSGLRRVTISSFFHHLVENHRYPRAPLGVENFELCSFW